MRLKIFTLPIKTVYTVRIQKRRLLRLQLLSVVSGAIQKTKMSCQISNPNASNALYKEDWGRNGRLEPQQPPQNAPSKSKHLLHRPYKYNN
jgi:hypothetical protein